MLSSLKRWDVGTGLFERTSRQTICFDVSDLISYFRSARAPTGIQRVQIEIIAALLRGPNDQANAFRVCAFSEQRGCWSAIPNTFFLWLCDLSLAGGSASQTVWRALLRVIVWRLRFSKSMRFAPGSALVNLGTSWALKNYFLSLHNAKAKYKIHYIPFVHDFIPLMTPEHCVPGVVRDFTAWVTAVFDHADHFLVNSQATRADLLLAAKSLGREVAADAVTVVPLNAQFKKSRAAKHSSEQLDNYGLKARGYVLLVSTIESRKNHLGAFSAWEMLIGKHGAADTPALVCVGKEGWLSARVHTKLSASAVLQSRVVMLENLSDDALAQLYDNCLFTFYPSHYEGWGLPVTESLCCGKVPLTSMSSSLPEAGGPFADYFDAGSQASMVVALERLIFDVEHRAEREKYIATAFLSRSWIGIGMQIEQAAAQVTGKSVPAQKTVFIT